MNENDIVIERGITDIFDVLTNINAKIELLLQQAERFNDNMDEIKRELKIFVKSYTGDYYGD